MLRVRFKANYDDYRPVNWPVKHPYWCTGYAGDGSHSIVVSYADTEQYIYDNWPEAEDLDSDEVEEYLFTDRFPKPDWFNPPGKSSIPDNPLSERNIKMDEKYNILQPDSKISDLVKMALSELIKNDFNAFEFDIQGVGPSGPVVMHFEVTMQQTAHS